MVSDDFTIERQLITSEPGRVNIEAKYYDAPSCIINYDEGTHSQFPVYYFRLQHI